MVQSGRVAGCDTVDEACTRPEREKREETDVFSRETRTKLALERH